ncbi:phenylacetate-CoA ligase [Desulfofundulus australicus DSM 11792]|uniref:Phenylacetate-CoA ligase n=1 Tax=Desulfofundulus australicus DSM 11792 TaxID=1121425 RepID=A0A1M4VG79_9FIRM|nr:phenylacetate--CoA ligase family protein [Desulfofundulus australicus]SHE68026.1 phenylacetate-CoA ligase [Desulfofundulus australicus DSM 11792]
MVNRVRGWLYKVWLNTSGRGDEFSHLQELRRAERLPKKQIYELQQERLHRLLTHAYENVPYYRTLLKEHGWTRGLPKSAVFKFSQTLPFLTKEIIRERFDELRSEDLPRRKWFYNTSGGSTGEPVRFIQDSDYHQWAQAGKMLFDKWTGYSVGMPKIVLWGSERDLLVGNETLRTRIGRWLRNEHWLNTFRMTEADMQTYVQRINAVRPVQILAYVESIYELAKFIEREGLKVHTPRAIMTSAGTLYPHIREVIERVFMAPVFNRYGSREVGDMACECEAHQGLHVNPLTHYLEIVKPDGQPCAPGEVGEV